MKTLLHFTCLFLIFCVTIISCQKIALQPSKDGALLLGENMKTSATANFQIVSAPFTPIDDDSIERPTILGVQLTNPYLIPNMQQAYKNLGYNPNMATITNLYVRFLPTTDQLAALDSTMDAQGLELFDTPVDYDVLYEGDYYQDPSVPDSLPTWLYSVVPPNFQFPAGIQYQTLAQIHIPDDNYTAIETEAERLASIQDSLNQQMISMNGTVHPNVPMCPPGYHWDFTTGKCVACPSGYQWNGTACVPISCPNGYYYNGTSCVPYNTTPPPPAADGAVPAGNIYVLDTNLPSIAASSPGNVESEFGVRKVRVVARRWFKIERVFTDNSGHFVFTKHFKHKVRIIEKFKNADAYIYGMRGVRLWQMIFPVKRTLGIYSGNKSNIIFDNDQAGPVNSKGNRYWVAATVHNTVQEHNDYAAQFSFSKMPEGMHIFITNWASQAGSASTPLFRERRLFGLLPPLYFVKNYMIGSLVAVAAANIASLIGLDMVLDYQPTNGEFFSDGIKESAYHEMSHASDYSQVGNTWYGIFVTDELNELQKHPGNYDQYDPYGDGNSSNSPIIALGEAWAYHMEHFLADQRYGVNAYNQSEQPGLEYNPTGTNHPDIDVLEYFVPTYNLDPFKWIPKGLMEDLMDNTTEPLSTGVNDQVYGFTIAQIFAALQSDVTSVPAYKARLIQQNPGYQTSQVTSLFASYNY